MEVGFNKDIMKKNSNIYESYVGKPGVYAVGNVSAYGILKEINFQEGYLKIQPSIVACGCDKLRLEAEGSTIIKMESGNPLSMRPLKKGDLEKHVEEYNKDNSEPEENQVS